MGSISNQFSVPYPIDRAVIAVQDSIDQFGWRVLELSSSMFVVELPGNSGQMAYFPKLRISLRESAGGTDIELAASWAALGNKRIAIGSMGQLTNSVSLRVQTDSVAINPTVAVGSGQGVGTSAPGNDRLAQLERLKALLDSGILTDDEFEVEKRRILSDASHGHEGVAGQRDASRSPLPPPSLQ